MNLVKAQALANDLPITELKKYADGFNPNMIPPWVAAGVMQEKMATQQKMANMQGAAQGAQPSVKEQIEQKAGLMALQQQMKQQSMGGTPPMGSMPVPEGAPQPEPQPEAGMASGGIARLPVQFGFQGGGIVAFSGDEGSYVKLPDGRRIHRSKLTEEDKARLAAQTRMYVEGAKAAAATRAAESPSTEEAPRRAAPAVQEAPSDYEAALLSEAGVAYTPAAPRQAPRQAAPAVQEAPSDYEAALFAEAGLPNAAASKSAAQVPQASYSNEGRRVPAPASPAVTEPPKAPANDLASALAQLKTPKAAPTAPAARMPAPQQESSFKGMAESAANALNQAAPTPEGTIKEANKLMPGVISEEAQKRLYEGQQKRISDLEAQYGRTKPSGLDDLIRVLGASGKYKGWSGLSGAYAANEDAKRADELNFRAKMDALRTGSEKEEQAGARDTFARRSDLYKEQSSQHMQNLRQRSSAIAQMYNVDQGRIDNVLRNLTSIEVAKISAAAQGRPTETERFMEKYVGLMATNPKAASEFLDTISTLKGAGKADPGLKDPAYKAAVEDANRMQRMADATTDPAKKKQYQDAATLKRREAEGYLRGGNRGNTGVNSELFNRADAIIGG